MSEPDAARPSASATRTGSPWAPDYSGPEPRPAPVDRPTDATAWSPPSASDVPDPWSREAARRAQLDDPGAAAVGPDADGELLGQEQAQAPAAARRRRVVAGMAVLVMMAACLVAVRLPADRVGRSGADVRVPRLPADARPIWTSARDHPIHDVLVTDDAVIVAGDGRIAALDPASGAELWTGNVPLSRSILVTGPADGVIVVFDVEHARAVGIDLSDGERLWQRRGSDRRGVLAADGAVLELGRGGAGGRDVMVLHPRTGRPTTERFAIVTPLAEGRYLPVRDGSSMRMLDVRRRSLVGPAIDLDVALSLVSATLVGGVVVGTADDGTFVRFDPSGRVRDRSEIATDSRTMLSVVGTSGADVVVATGERSVGVDVGGDELDVVWSRDRRVEAIGSTLVGRQLLFGGAGGIAVADATTGEDRASLGAADPGAGRVLLADNGVLVRRGREVVAYGLDGDRWWTIDAGAAPHVAGPGLVAVFDGTEITAYG